MADVSIDIKRVRNTNYAVPGMLSSLDRSEKSVNMLKWRIPGEVQNRRDIRNRLAAIVRDISRAEEMLGKIYRITEEGINQYSETERRLDRKAGSDFI